MDNNETSSENTISSPTVSKPDVAPSVQNDNAPMNTPFVSIIMPIRNEAAYIVGCLTAVFEQDYPSERMEILIADGMSDDDTRAIIQKISKENDIPVFILDNPGRIVPTGLNLAIRKARGDIIIRVDGHCNIAPDYVSKCVEHIQKDGVDGVGGSMESIGETSMAEVIAIGMSSPFGVGNSSFRTVSGKSMLVDTVPFPAYTRQIIQRAGFYDEELVRNQDDEYNYRIRKLGGKILLASDVHSIYYSRTSGTGLWKQYFQYGYWKVRVLQKLPGQMSLRQFIPPAFVLGLLASGLLALVPGIGILAPVIPLLYLFANLAASYLTASRKGWKHFPLLPYVFATLHIGYGLGFLAGLVKFWNRWGDKVGKVQEVPVVAAQPQAAAASSISTSAAAGYEPETTFPIRLGDVLKRTTDILGSFLGLLFLWPMFLLAAVLIKRDSQGPVFYRSTRSGRNGKPFQIIKFRTMIDSGANGGGPSITAQDDPRITPLGRWLRVTKLNEFPQLWNVLKGEMSLVGPRPEVPEIVATWSEEVRRLVLSIRPGMTSPASVIYRNEEELLTGASMMDEYLNRILPDKLRLDQLYVHNHSLIADLDVIFWTLIGLLPRIKHATIPENTLYWGPLSSFFNRYFTWFLGDFFVAFVAVAISGVIWRLGEPINLGIWLDIGIAILIAILFSIINALLGLDRISWRHARPGQAFDLAFSSSLTTAALFAMDWYWRPAPLLPLGMILIIGLLAFFGFTSIRYRERLLTGLATRWVSYRSGVGSLGDRVLIVGAGECGQMAAWLMQKSNLSTAFSIVGMVDDDPRKYRMRIDGHTVLGTTRDIPALVRQKNIGVIMYAINRIGSSRQEQILKTCRALPVRLVIIPDLIKIVQDYLLQPEMAAEETAD